MSDRKMIYLQEAQGRNVAESVTFDPQNVPNDAEKAVLTGIQHNINYVKADAGVPTGTGTNGEKCLNTNEAKVYSYTSSWDAGVACTALDKHVFKDTGSDSSDDSGTYTADDKIYYYIDSAFTEVTPHEGLFTRLLDDDLFIRYSGSAWIVSLLSIVPSPYKFVRKGGLGQSQSNIDMYDDSGSVTEISMRGSGSIVGVTINTSSTVTGGTLTVKPTLDAADITAAALLLAMTTGTGLTGTVNPGVETFTDGQVLGVHVNSDAGYLPADQDIVVIVDIVKD